jgi:hypothetical protein
MALFLERGMTNFLDVEYGTEVSKILKSAVLSG